MSQNVYYVAYPRSSQAYSDARTPTWLNQIRYYNVCLKFCVAKCLSCCISQKRSGNPRVQPGWNSKIYNICLKFFLKMVTMLHIPKALRDTVKPGLQPGCTRKYIQIRVETQLYLYFWLYSIIGLLVYSLYFLT